MGKSQEDRGWNKEQETRRVRGEVTRGQRLERRTGDKEGAWGSHKDDDDVQSIGTQSKNGLAECQLSAGRMKQRRGNRRHEQGGKMPSRLRKHGGK